MKGMPLAPSQRGAAGRAPSQHLKGGNFGKALVNIAPPPSAAPVAQLAPLQISAHKALKSSSTSSPARHPFSETWPRRSGETLAQQVIGAARQWRERARKAPAGLKPELATGEGSSSSTVGEDAPPRLFIVVKPFGKGGIRLAWQRSSSEQDEALFVEFEGDAREWVQHSEIQPAGNESGVATIKTIAGPGPPPAKRVWRLRSSSGDTSAALRLGQKSGQVMPPPAPSSGATAAELMRLDPEALVAMVQARQGEVDCLLRVDLSTAEVSTNRLEPDEPSMNS